MAYESEHQGEFGFYRIVFAGLGESDDPEIRTALSRMYLRFQGFIREQIEPGDAASKASPDAALRAWAILGLGTMSNIAQEFGLMSRRTRERLLQEVGLYLLEGRR